MQTLRQKHPYPNGIFGKMNQMIDYLENFVSIPNQIIYQLVDSIEQKLQQHESLEFIADHVREVLAVSVDNANLLYSLEKSGIYISERLINGNADAYSAWSRNGRPLSFWDWENQRYDIILI